MKRQCFQWTLRGLLFLTTACAIGAGVFASRQRREREVIAWLNESGASVTVETNGPDWLRSLAGDHYFQHATVVQFSLGYPIGTAPPATIQVEEVRRLEALPKLRLLDLDRFAVCEETLTALGRLRAIEILTIGRSYNGGMAAVERLADAHPDWAIDLAPAERLYHSVAMRHDKAIFGTLKTLEAVFDMRTAARWKLTATKWKRGALDEIAAQRQPIAGLETLRRQDEQQEQLDPGSLRFELAYIRCVTDLANLKMIRARGDHPTASTADSFRDAADKLIALVQDDLKQGLLDTFDTVDALQIAGDVLIATCKAADSEAA